MSGQTLLYQHLLCTFKKFRLWGGTISGPCNRYRSHTYHFCKFLLKKQLNPLNVNDKCSYLDCPKWWNSVRTWAWGSTKGTNDQVMVIEIDIEAPFILNLGLLNQNSKVSSHLPDVYKVVSVGRNVLRAKEVIPKIKAGDLGDGGLRIPLGDCIPDGWAIHIRDTSCQGHFTL